jgi:large subunit ribosomal protein L13
MKKNPIAVVEKAVKGMLPKNRLGSKLLRNMFVYAGAEHKHEAQKPRKINLNEIK